MCKRCTRTWQMLFSTFQNRKTNNNNKSQFMDEAPHSTRGNMLNTTVQIGAHIGASINNVIKCMEQCSGEAWSKCWGRSGGSLIIPLKPENFRVWGKKMWKSVILYFNRVLCKGFSEWEQIIQNQKISLCAGYNGTTTPGKPDFFFCCRCYWRCRLEEWRR